MRKPRASRMAQRTEARWGLRAQRAGWRGEAVWSPFHVRVDTTPALLLDGSDWAQILALPLTVSITLEIFLLSVS